MVRYGWKAHIGPSYSEEPRVEILMAKLVFGMNQSLDGYVDHMAFAPSPTLFRHFIEEAQGQAGSVYGRQMYEVMRYPDSTDELIVGGNLAPVGCGDGPGMGLEGFGQGGEGARGPGWRRRGGSGGIWAGGCPVRAGRGECRDGRRPLGQVG